MSVCVFVDLSRPSYFFMMDVLLCQYTWEEKLKARQPDRNSKHTSPTKDNLLNEWTVVSCVPCAAAVCCCIQGVLNTKTANIGHLKCPGGNEGPIGVIKGSCVVSELQTPNIRSNYGAFLPFNPNLEQFPKFGAQSHHCMVDLPNTMVGLSIHHGRPS